MSKARYRFTPRSRSRAEDEYDDEFLDSPFLPDLTVYSPDTPWEDTGLVTAEGVPIERYGAEPIGFLTFDDTSEDA
jgi:hypothetical protein